MKDFEPDHRKRGTPGIKPLAAALVALAVFSAAARAGVNVWTSNWQVEGGSVYCLAADPNNQNNLYAGTRDHGVFQSTDGADSWTAIGKIFHTGPWGIVYENWVFGLLVSATDPSVIVARTNDFGTLYRSTDAGRTWSSLRSVLPEKSFSCLIHFGGGFLTSAETGEMYYSRDGGATWGTVFPGLTNVRVTALASSGTLYAGTDQHGVFRCTNGGSWEPVNVGISSKNITSLACDPASSGTVYAGIGEGAVFKSVDSGNFWGPSLFNLPPYSSVNALQVSGSTVTAITKIGGSIWGGTITAPVSHVYESRNGGGTWAVADAGLPGTVFHALEGSLLGTAGGGVFKRAGGGWEPANAGLRAVPATTVAVDPNDPAIVYAGSGDRSRDESGGIFRSTDGGGSWELVSGCLGCVSIEKIVCAPPPASAVYAVGMGATARNLILMSTDQGATWDEADAGVDQTKGTGVSSFAVHPGDPEVLYATASCDVYRSTNGGYVWRNVQPQPTMACTGGYPITVDYDGVVYMDGSYSSDAQRSEDGGYSWLPLKAAGGLLCKFFVSPFDGWVYACFFPATSWDFAWLRSANHGETWEPMPENYTLAWWADPPTMYAKEYCEVSADGGNTWTNFDTGLAGLGWIGERAMHFSTPNRQHVCTSMGVFSITLQCTPEGLAQFLSGGVLVPQYGRSSADVNGDGRVDALDLAALAGGGGQ